MDDQTTTISGDLGPSFAVSGDNTDDDKTSLLETLGEEIIRIISPVSLCMFLVVLLVSSLSLSSDPLQLISSNLLSSSNLSGLNLSDSNSDSDSTWNEIKSALITSLSFVILVTLMTFILLLLFYFRCTKFLKIYMGISSFYVLSFLGGFISLLILSQFKIAIDVFTFSLLLINFSVAGVSAIFLPKFPISLNQGFLVLIGVLTSYCFTFLPEWTTWVLLIAMSLYDLAAVLLPIGPLRLLVELAISRNEDIPALVYEARPVNPVPNSQMGIWRPRTDLETNPIDNVQNNTNFGTDPIDNIPNNTNFGTNPVDNLADNTNFGTDPIDNSTNYTDLTRTGTEPVPNTRPVPVPDTRLLISDEITAPLISTIVEEEEQDELNSSGGIKLGLGDFIFYSVLVGRAAMYDYMTVYACYLAIIAGLGITLMLLAFYHKALPALPVSVMLGVVFYLLTRVLLEGFVLEYSSNLLMF